MRRMLAERLRPAGGEANARGHGRPSLVRSNALGYAVSPRRAPQ